MGIFALFINMQTSVKNGGTDHTIASTSSVHAAGAWHAINQIWAHIAGAWQQVYSSSVAIVIAAGQSGGSPTRVGYNSGAFGNLTSVTGLAPGLTLFAIFEDRTSTFTRLIITGFGADPTSAFFTTMLTPSNTLTSASASYIYSTGQAQWTWSSNLAGFTNGVSSNITLTH